MVRSGDVVAYSVQCLCCLHLMAYSWYCTPRCSDFSGTVQFCQLLVQRDGLPHDLLVKHDISPRLVRVRSVMVTGSGHPCLIRAWRRNAFEVYGV